MKYDAYNYWKKNQEKKELDNWKEQLIFDIKNYIDSRLVELKKEIIGSINNEISIYATTYLNGRKLAPENLSNLIFEEITKSIKI